MIDQATFDTFTTLSLRARQLGLSLAEVLDSQGLLLTPARMKAIRLDILTDLHRAVEEIGVGRMMGPEASSRGATPADAHRAMLDFIERFAAQLPD